MKYRYGELTWPEVKAAAARPCVAIVPIATLEDHGPHLPIDTDLLLCTSVCELAASPVRKCQPFVAPSRPYEASVSFFFASAIAGVMGAYLVKFPRSEVKMLTWFIFIFTFDVPAWAMLIYWFAIQLFGGYGSLGDTSQGGTAFFAHIGGFIMGIVLIYTLCTRQRYWRREDLSW